MTTAAKSIGSEPQPSAGPGTTGGKNTASCSPFTQILSNKSGKDYAGGGHWGPRVTSLCSAKLPGAITNSDLTWIYIAYDLSRDQVIWI